MRAVEVDEVERFDALLENGHYLGKARRVGGFLCQVAVIDGKWVAQLAWGSAAYRLKPREN